MLDIKALKVALEQLEQEKKIAHEKVVDAVEKSLAAAYQKEYGKRGQIVRCQINFDTGETHFEQVRIAGVRDREQKIAAVEKKCRSRIDSFAMGNEEPAACRGVVGEEVKVSALIVGVKCEGRIGDGRSVA